MAELFSHNLWANLRLIDFCAALDDPQLDAAAPGTAGSIRETLVHILMGEQWYVRLLSDQQLEHPIPETFPGFDVLREHAQWSGQALIHIATDMPPDDVRRDVPGGPPYTFKAIALLIQAINHGAEHRGGIATALSTLGITPPHIDGWAYAEAEGMIEGWRFYND